MTPRVVSESRPSGVVASDAAVLGALSREIRRQLARGVRTTLEEFRDGSASEEAHAFWSYATTPSMYDGADPAELLADAEYRVLSKASSGGGFLVPTDLADMVISAARSKSPIAQLAQEWVTEKGDTFGVPTAATHGTAAPGWPNPAASRRVTRRSRRRLCRPSRPTRRS